MRVQSAESKLKHTFLAALFYILWSPVWALPHSQGKTQTPISLTSDLFMLTQRLLSLMSRSLEPASAKTTLIRRPLYRDQGNVKPLFHARGPVLTSTVIKQAGLRMFLPYRKSRCTETPSAFTESNKRICGFSQVRTITQTRRKPGQEEPSWKKRKKEKREVMAPFIVCPGGYDEWQAWPLHSCPHGHERALA
ncbi:hypothetical protein Baya_10770 [Bagarius yarrelli]|uniref:Uncharacterized protein n=1 Tax=Bagarius yarrelli TaxID=175774 RepID=A0A556UZA7_BAGYA|nr:hypothetical protein Baya_10770 [Bagarius yarrelli]